MEYVDGGGLDSEGVAIPSRESITKKKHYMKTLSPAPGSWYVSFHLVLRPDHRPNCRLSTNCGTDCIIMNTLVE